MSRRAEASYDEVEDAIGTYHCYRQSQKAVLAAGKQSHGVTMITIPAKVKPDRGVECTVSTIGEGAFYLHLDDGAEKISFEEGSQVTSFQDASFGSVSLRVLEIPAQVRYIHNGAFRGTESLTKVVVHEKNEEFKNKEGCVWTADESKLVFVPRDKSGCFRIPAGVREIGGFAFENCREISKIEFDQPGCLEAIGDGAFSGTAITEFTVPASVSKFGVAVFRGCKSLRDVRFEADVRIEQFGICLFEGCVAVESLVVPKSVRVLASKCLSRMIGGRTAGSVDVVGLKTLSFEEGSKLEVIQADVFYMLPITKIEIPDSLVELDECNFFGCDFIEEFVIGAGNERLKWDSGLGVLTSMRQVDDDSRGSFEDKVHYARRNITQYEIPDTVKVITDSAFHGCRALKLVWVTCTTSALEKIGSFAFSQTGLVRFYVPSSVRVIDHDAFLDCRSLVEIIFRDAEHSSLTTIGSRAFSKSAIDKSLMPDSVQHIGSRLFANSAIRMVRWPKDVLTVPVGTFLDCKDLEKLVFMTERDVVVDNDGLPDHVLAIYCREGVDIKVKDGGTLDGVEKRRDIETDRILEDEQKLAKAVEPRLDFSDLILDPSDWVLKHDQANFIGKGSFGSVYKAKRKSDNTIAAVKAIPGNEDDDNFKKEVKVLAKLVHPAICGIIGAVLAAGDTKPGIYMEYYSNKSLSGWIFGTDGYDRNQLNATRLAKIIAGICYGMRYVHAMGVIHKDFKPQNILLDREFEPKIADFGSATITNSTMTMTLSITTALGGMTRKYIAPELLDPASHEGGMTPAVDVYAFGVSLWEILTGAEFQKHRGFQTGSFEHHIISGERPNLTQTLKHVDPVVREVIENSWCCNPEARYTFDQIIEKMTTIGWRVTTAEPEAEAVEQYLRVICDFEEKYPPTW